MKKFQKDPLDTWIVDPISQFIHNSTASGIVMFISAVLALILANSPWGPDFINFWELEVSLKIGETLIERTLHHWINDGLMAIFFFVVGLELKRELLAGELSDFRKAILPFSAAIGGMLVPAFLYFLINAKGEGANGWGIPIATDIAFALGIIYLLGDRVPSFLKILLTTLAIVDDLGAVSVIAIFYTSQIDLNNLTIGIVFLLILGISNLIGIRSTLYYSLFGTIGLWYSFLQSGIHTSIAAVLLAFTIPLGPKISRSSFKRNIEYLIAKLPGIRRINAPIISEERLEIATDIRNVSKKAIPPLQRLEHGLHPFVSFIILPLFALSNAAITLPDDIWTQVTSNVFLGIFVGLVLGKVIGVGTVVYLLVKSKLAMLPEGINTRHIIGIGFLAGVGFTMSLFITSLAFSDLQLINQAKAAIIGASVIASFLGYFVLKYAGNST
jgi:NhaA family Na+:H+ antiporter